MIMRTLGIACVLCSLAACTNRASESAAVPKASAGAVAAAPRDTGTSGSVATHAKAAAPDANTSLGATGVKTEEAMFGAGCFWGVEAYFRKVPGVVETSVGYSGGNADNPTYRQVCSDATGHAEVIHIDFDPTKVTYEALVRHFFRMHDPTQLNRQGPDYGRQYRSAIFTYSDEQKATAVRVRDALGANPKYATRKIVTEIEPAKPFWKAEDYHQKYLEKNGMDSCHVIPEDEESEAVGGG